MGESPIPDDQIAINLKNPARAALLAWLVPGLGHIYQGRTGKGILFAVCILSTFFYGMYLGGGRVVYASTTNPVGNFKGFIDRWQYGCQVPVGLVALPAYMQTWRVESGSQPLFGDNVYRPAYTPADIDRLYTNPQANREAETRHLTTKLRPSEPGNESVVYHPNEAAKWQHDYAFYFELGTVYTVIAGLLNILAIYDAHSGPVLPHADDKKKSPEPPTT